jgi:hypothetical protein
MVAEVVFSFVLGAIVLIATSYIGTTMALRGFFGREYSNSESRSFPNSDNESSEEPEERS